MKFWGEDIDYSKSRKVLVIPNITNSKNIEKDSFVDVIHNHIKGLESYGDYFWHIILPKPVKKLNLSNVEQHILPFSGDMIKMRTYPPDMNKVLEEVDYDVIYSHLPDWPQVGRYKKDFDVDIVGYCHWWEMKSSNAVDRKMKWRWIPVELLGVLQMKRCYINTQDQKDRVLEEAGAWFNEQTVSKLDDILTVWHLGLELDNIVDTEEYCKNPDNVIVFNHRAAGYKGFPQFMKLMEEYRERRDDFTVWVPQLNGSSEFGWVDNTKLPKNEYYKRLRKCKVGIQMRQSNYGWSVSATDCMMNGTPMIFQESDCYREIQPDGEFFRYKKDLFEMLDKILDDDEYRKELEIKAIARAYELSNNEKEMLKELDKELH